MQNNWQDMLYSTVRYSCCESKEIVQILIHHVDYITMGFVFMQNML